MGRTFRLRTLGMAAGGALVIALTTGADKPREEAYGFVLTSMQMSFYRGDEKIDCPEGRSNTVREAFLATQSATERERLLKPENSVEFERKYKEDFVNGPGSRNLCTDSAYFDTPDRALQKTVQSKVGPGLDLDGAAPGQTAPGTCAHESFTSPTGEPGVDNQFFRAVACNTAWRGASTGIGDFAAGFRFADRGAVVLVRDVQSWANDPHVEVIIAASSDKPTLDAEQNTVPGSSLNVLDNPRYRNVLNGRIEDGVLTTEPANLVLPYNWVGASGGELVLNHIRLKVRLTPERGLRGQAGAYQPIDNAIAVPHVGGPGVASVAGLECASVRKTLRVLADGDRDPKTGQCGSVSIGLNFEAAPAFVFDKGVLAGAPGGGGIRQAQK